MSCNSCRYEFCWICSLPYYSKKHEVFKPFCEVMNGIVYNLGYFEEMWFKCIWLRFVAYFLLTLIGPILLIALSPLLMIFALPCIMYKEL